MIVNLTGAMLKRLKVKLTTADLLLMENIWRRVAEETDATSQDIFTARLSRMIAIYDLTKRGFADPEGIIKLLEPRLRQLSALHYEANEYLNKLESSRLRYLGGAMLQLAKFNAYDDKAAEIDGNSACPAGQFLL